jgi:hypothetical protein
LAHFTWSTNGCVFDGQRGGSGGGKVCCWLNGSVSSTALLRRRR